MKHKIGEIIKVERVKRGWDQAELASRLAGGIRQQAVSGWERGLSRPTRNMIPDLAKALELDEAVLLAAAGHSTKPPERGSVMPPVRPRVTTLRLEDLAADRFEQFGADLVQHLNPGLKVSRYGGQGHKQHGVDGVVRSGKKYKSTFQSKKRQNFGAAEVRKAIAEVTIEADEHVLLLSRVASPAAREEVRKYEHWDLWDSEDISRRVRGLPLEAARRLVDTYFPGWREPFLGIREPGPWLTPDEFFLRFTGDQIFSHDWKYVGSKTVLESVKNFLGSNDPIGLIIGRGGSGKTRLLREITEYAEQELGFTVFLLDVGRSATLQSYESLPSDDNLLVIIDDAHERNDVAEVVDGVIRRNPDAKILLAMRPYGFSQLASDLRRISMHPSDLPKWELDELTVSDAEELAREIMGKDAPSKTVRRLAQVTHDCPLITVVGAGLIKRGLLDPNRLESDETVQQDILRAFRDALVVDPTKGDPDVFNKLLNGLAILQPVAIKDDAFIRALEQLTGKPLHELMPYIKGLEDSGVLIRRGQSLRIVPDLLGDVILAEACFDQRSAVSTGYLEEIHRKLEGQPLQNVLVNASRVDWQVNRQSQNAPSLIDSLWAAVEKEFHEAGIHGRTGLLKLVQKVAYFQPDRAIALAKWAIDNPTKKVEKLDHPLAGLYSPKYEDVLQQVPRLLRLAAYTVDCLPDALDLLWNLAKSDHRQTNQHPEHPIRVLSDLASYEIGKPLSANEAVVDAAERWLTDENVSNLPYSPFDVLEPLLATEGSDDSTEGLKVMFRPYAINLTAVKDIRERVIALILQEVQSSNPKRVTTALRALGDSLRYPAGLFERIVTDEERDKWTPVFVETMQRVGKVVGNKDQDPVLGIALRQAIRWHAHFSKTPTRKAARSLIAKLPQTIEGDVALALHDGWGRVAFDHVEDYRQAELQKEAWFEQVAKKLLSSHTDQEILDLIENRLIVHKKAFGEYGTPGPFVWTLTKARPSIGKLICDTIAENPSSPLESVLPVVLSQMAESQPDVALDTARKLLAIDNLRVTQGVAQAFGWNRGLRKLIEGEKELLFDLAKHQNPYVRNTMVRAAQLIAKEHASVAIEILSLVEFSDSADVAKEVFSTFTDQGYLNWEALSNSQAKRIWDQLRECPSIDDYNITEFLSNFSKNHPNEVLKLLKDRVEYWEQMPDRKEGNNFDALPHIWGHSLQIRNHSQFAQYLREIRDWISESPESWQRQHAGVEIFWLAAGQVDQMVIDVLDEALRSGSKEQLETVASILREAPRKLVWDEVEFVTRALNTANSHGEEALQNLGGNLYAIVAYGSRSGTAGEPFPEDIEHRDKAARIVKTLPPGSVEAHFYSSLEKSAIQNIKRHGEEGEQMRDGRDW